MIRGTIRYLLLRGCRTSFFSSVESLNMGSPFIATLSIPYRLHEMEMYLVPYLVLLLAKRGILRQEAYLHMDVISSIFGSLVY